MRLWPVSFGAKLFAISAFALLSASIALTAADAYLIRSTLHHQVMDRAEAQRPFFAAALAHLLAERDFATIREVLRESVQSRGLAHMVLADAQGRVVAAEGWDVERDGMPRASSVPVLGVDGTRRMSFEAPIHYSGQALGHLFFGISWEPIEAAQKELLLVSSIVAGCCLIVVLLLAALVHGRLMRPMTRLRIASERVARGEYAVELSPDGRDDIGALKRSFLAMAAEIQRRVSALTESEAVQRRLLAEAQDRQRDLARAKDAAEAAATAKSRFLAMMSHEIRTPMNAVVGMSSVLRETALDERQRRYAGVIEESAVHLLTIIDDILDFSRLEIGGDRPDPAPTDLRALAATAIELTRGLPGARSLAISETVAPDVPAVVVADRGRLLQLMLNLLTNAVKFTRAGTVMLSIRMTECEGDRATFRFAVADTGIGIDPNVRLRLFEPFEQFAPVVAGQRSGTGLGLAICRRLVGLMDGTIGVDSEVGRGSTFWFDLTFDSGAAPASIPTEPLLVRSPVRRLRILVAEDSATSRMVAEAILGQLGHDVVFAANGAEAVASVVTDHVDLILMDVQMPVLDGHDATRRIRAIEGPTHSVPIVALTAYAEPADRARALEAGMDDHLSKPIRRSDLEALIDRLLPRIEEFRRQIPQR